MGLDFTSLTSPPEVERAANNYTAAIHTAIEAAVPKIEPHKRRIRGWWTKELDELTQKANLMQRKARQNPTDKNLIDEARKMRNFRRNEVRAAKQSYLMLKLQNTGPADV